MSNKKIVVFLGTHCSWKSSYARSLVWYKNEWQEQIDYRWYKITVGEDRFAMGHYHNACGGVDWFWAISKSKQAFTDLACERQESLMIVEWVLLVTEPVFQALDRARIKSGRDVYIVFLDVSPQVSMERLYWRNGWKPVWPGIINKWTYFRKRIMELWAKFKQFKQLYINTDWKTVEDWLKQVKDFISTN
jgi:hypothetical protein